MAEFVNSVGTIQGGIIAAMLDDTMTPAAAAHLGGNHIVPTLELKISFIRPQGLAHCSATVGCFTVDATFYSLKAP